MMIFVTQTISIVLAVEKELKMPKGIVRDWTLEELEFIWNFDGNGEFKTVKEAMASIGVRHQTWYNIRARLMEAGSPEVLYEKMQEDKKRRYNRASKGKIRRTAGNPLTLEDAVTRTYLIRVGMAGRDSNYEQYSITIPPVLARPFINQFGNEITFQPMSNGLMIKPIPRLPRPELPDWVKEEE